MKNLYCALIGFCCFSLSFAMDRGDDWLMVPFVEVKSQLKKFSSADCTRMFNNKNQRLLAFVGALPGDTIKTIVLKMLDDEKIDEESLQRAANKFISMPILCAFEEYYIVKEVFKGIPQLHDKSVGMFFGLSYEEQKFLLFIERAPVSQVDPNIIVIAEHHEERLNNLPEAVFKEFVKGRQCVVIPSKSVDNMGTVQPILKAGIVVGCCAAGITNYVGAPWYISTPVGLVAFSLPLYWWLANMRFIANNTAKQKIL